MPATKEITIYKWEELSQSAKDKARSWYLGSMDYEWWECLYEETKKEGYELGFLIDNIYFSGFCSQGDGASWIGQVDVRQWLETHAKDSIGVSAWCALIQEDVISKHVSVVANNAHYCHESTMSFGDIEDDAGGFIDGYCMELKSIFQGLTIESLFDIIATDDNCTLKTTEDITSAITESGRDYAIKIYKQLREEYEYLCSEEMMLDHFHANDYHFTDEGALA